MSDGHRICDGCGDSRFEVICRRDRRGKPLNTVMCLRCGLVGHEQIPNQQELAEYYAAQYRKEYHGEETPSTRRIWRAWLKGKRVLHDLAPSLRPASKVFEVGAGIGCTVRVFEMAGFDASGIEPGSGFQKFSQNQLKARVRQRELADCTDFETYDLVLFVHVIEHMRSPRQALQTIHRLLKPDGRLYLECPSLGKVHADLAELFHFAHIWTFAPVPLLSLLRQCGFMMEKCFSDGIGRNHKFLLRKTTPIELPADPSGVSQTRDFVRAFRSRWHRVGLDYFAHRAKRIAIYLREYVWGSIAVRKILREAQNGSSQAA